jgi:hypothetical protein
VGLKQGGAGQPRLSVVTVCMNRRDHLWRSAPVVAQLPWHDEHLVVDWSSREPLRREDLPPDPRLRLLRVEGEGRWNLCRAYNFGFAQATGELILKLDADAWPTERFDPAAAQLRGLAADPSQQQVLCAFGSGPEGRKGQFLIERRLLAAVGGFNELLVGYGFDDKDLLARLGMQLGIQPAPIPEAWLAVIAHSDAERAERGAGDGAGSIARNHGEAAMRATRLANRLVAAHCPWGPRSLASRYQEEQQGRWRVEPASVPHPPGAVAAEIEHACRMTFWGHFLAIPEVFLEVLPYRLFPPARRGVWQVRLWHRLWWFTGRQLLQLPVRLVVGAMGLARRGQGRPGPQGGGAPRLGS